MSKFKELFDEADLNSDGKLDKDEMAQNLKEREEWIKGEAASETMEVADDNKDGKVSLNEVIKNAGEYGAKTEDFFEVSCSEASCVYSMKSYGSYRDLRVFARQQFSHS
jgi:hypothetical protein